MSYTLDTNAAKQADNIFSKIDSKGAYFGVITRAEAVESRKGTKGIDMSFKAESGATADYLTIWTHNGEGKQLQGYNLLMALMTCLQLKELNAEQGEIEKYDTATRQKINVQATLYKGLMNKPVGLLMTMEEYNKTAGGTAWKPVIYAPFNAEGFTASEVLNRATQPEKMELMKAALRDKPLAASAQVSQQSGSTVSDLTDDIPF